MREANAASNATAAVRVLAVLRIAPAPSTTAGDPIVVKLPFFNVRWVVLAPGPSSWCSCTSCPGATATARRWWRASRARSPPRWRRTCLWQGSWRTSRRPGTLWTAPTTPPSPSSRQRRMTTPTPTARRRRGWTCAGSQATRRTTSRRSVRWCRTSPPACSRRPCCPCRPRGSPAVASRSASPCTTRSSTARPCGGSWPPGCPPPATARSSPSPSPRRPTPGTPSASPTATSPPSTCSRCSRPTCRPVASTVADYDFSQRFSLARRTFYLAGDDILAAAEDDDDNVVTDGSTRNKKKPVSTFVALAALGWTSFVRAKGLAAGDDTYLLFQADLRARLDPPVGDGYLGNCVRGMLATADAGELLRGSGRGLLAASRAIQATVAEMEAAPLAGMEQWHAKMMGLPFARLAIVAASPRFRVYEAADFGFGRPKSVELVSMNHDGEMVLVGRREDGEVQLSMSLDLARMDDFKAHVFAHLRAVVGGGPPMNEVTDA